MLLELPLVVLIGFAAFCVGFFVGGIVNVPLK